MLDQAYYVERQQMVEYQLRERGIQDERVLEAMAVVPREKFVPGKFIDLAYADGPLPIGEGQTISQPYIVGLMSQMMELKGGERVLEVGTGSGYQAAVLSHLARSVHTIERIPALGERARLALADLGLKNVTVHIGDGSLGWVEDAPYQAILVTAAAPVTPLPLLEQLDEGGRLVIPVGRPGDQYLECWDRHGEDFSHEATLPVAFVPLRGQYGWSDNVLI